MALLPNEKILLALVLNYAAGSDNTSVIDNAVTQVLREQKVLGGWGHLKIVLNQEVLTRNRRLKKKDTRPKLVLT